MREIKVYSYNELSSEAKRRAYSEWLCYAEYPYMDDLYETLKEFENLFDGQISVQDADFSRGRAIFRSYFTHEVDMLSGVRLVKYLWNNYGDRLYKGKYYSSNNNPNRMFVSRRSKVLLECECPLTGCYTDYLILDKLIEFMHKPNANISLVHLIQICLNSFIREASKCIEDWYCEDIFHDECEVNDWEFFEDGERCYR